MTVSGGVAVDCGVFGPDLCAGGGILNFGTLTVNSSRIVNNTATGSSTERVEGGGICNDGTATVQIPRTRASSNAGLLARIGRVLHLANRRSALLTDSLLTIRSKQ